MTSSVEEVVINCGGELKTLSEGAMEYLCGDRDLHVLGRRFVNLAGKRVLVTGGNRGMGLAIVKAMAAAGAEVIAWGRDQEAWTVAAETLKDVTGTCSFHQVNVRDEQAVVAAVADAGPVDVLVNNAGIVGMSPARETPTKDIEDILATNVTAAFVVMREIVKGMVTNGGGLIINVASDAAVMGIGRMGANCASKHGLLGVGRCFSAELREHGVRVTTFCPGPISTDILGPGTANPDCMDPDALAGLLVSIAGWIRESKYRNCWPLRCASGHLAVFPRFIVHRDDILDRRVDLQVMARGKYVAGAVTGECIDAVTHLLPHLVRCSEGQYLLVLDGAIEAYPVAELRFQLLQIHTRTGPLDGVQNVDTHLNEGRKELATTAVVVVDNFDPELMAQINEAPVVRRVELPV
jgi:NAD(P)-dependent dehydrogenase (short-subunit alcohol dehydrogenase family)